MDGKIDCKQVSFLLCILVFVFLFIMSCQTFSFTTRVECVRVYLKNGPCLLLQNQSIATAQVSFTKEGAEMEVNVPEGLSIVNTTEGTTVSPCYPFQSHFILDFTCSYEIMWEGKKVLTLIQSHDWDPDVILLPAEQREWYVYVEE